LFILGGTVLGLLCLAFIALAVFAPAVKSYVRSRALQGLRDRFESRVEIHNLTVDLFPHFRITGAGMTFQRDDDLPPLVKADRIDVEASYAGLLVGHVRRVTLGGLEIAVPLGRKHDGDGRKKGASFPVVIDEIVSDKAHLEILRSKAEKPPLEFDIHSLRMQSVHLDRPADFQATLSNPQPRGEIETKGKFGPWQADEPSQTPVSGNYTFTNADLATFKGIGGILSSQGKYHGVLKRIEVDGETDTPGFFLSISGNPVPLHTSFHAVVDGSNGNTWLQPVNGKLQHSPITVNGEVTKVQDAHGRRILLDAVVNQGQLEDLLQLAVRSKTPPMSGAINLHTKIDLPPGDQDVVDKLHLEGEFDIRSARFSALDIRERLRGLSRKAQGDPTDESAGSSISNLHGHFQMKDGVATFSTLTMELEGASMQLTGSYKLRTEDLDFHGRVLLDAELSKTTTGAKAFFLKALDPFFHKKNGKGSEIPIKISGKRSSPSFGLDIAKKF
jgi:hypothetical protein